MVSTSTECADKPHHPLSSFNFLHENMDQETDLASTHGLVNSIFFIWTSKTMQYFATHAKGQLKEGKYTALSKPIKHS